MRNIAVGPLGQLLHDIKKQSEACTLPLAIIFKMVERVSQTLKEQTQTEGTNSLHTHSFKKYSVLQKPTKSESRYIALRHTVL